MGRMRLAEKLNRLVSMDTRTTTNDNPSFHSLSNRKGTAGVLNLPSVAVAAGIDGDRLVRLSSSLFSCCSDERKCTKAFSLYSHSARD